MRHLSFVPAVLIAGFLASALAGGSSSPPADTVVIRNVTVVNPAHAETRPGRTVVATAETITAVGGDEVPIPEGARIVDGTGKYLLPGLWDAHVHLVYGGIEVLPLFVANGVTGVRDLGGDAAQLSDWRGQVAAGKVVGPRIFMAGPVIESARFVAHVERIDKMVSGAGAPPRDREAERLARPTTVATPEQARTAVRAAARAGVDLVKARTFETAEVMRALAGEASSLGLRLAMHAPDAASVCDGLPPGAGSVEHMYFLDAVFSHAPDRVVDCAARLAAHPAWLVPTMHTESIRTSPDADAARRLAEVESSLGPALPRRLYASWARDMWIRRAESAVEPPVGRRAEFERNSEWVKRLHRAGLPMMVGTDFGAVGVLPGSAIHDELAGLVDLAGFTPMDALRAATWEPVRFLRREANLGTIETGKAADMVLLHGNPALDIRNSRRIALVVAAGRVMTPGAAR
jgi:imidazolonepropionase-like amidohydrolase